MNSQSTQIRKMESSEIQAVVDVHMRSFDGFFLTFLGRQFLYELYSGILNDSSGIVYIFYEGGLILGFVAGTLQPSGFYRRLLIKRWWRFGLASIRPLLKNPSIMPRLFRGLSKPSEAVNDENIAELMSLAVLPDQQRKGIGQELLKTFLQETSRCGLNKVKLLTDGVNNTGANIFYQDLGFKSVRTFTTPEGREMIEYRIAV